MIDPSLIAGTPFRSKTAFEDLMGTINLIHDGLIVAVNTLTGAAVAKYPFDAYENQDDFLEQIQQQHRALSRALGIPDPPDLQSFNLRDESEWVSWIFLLAADLTRLKDAAGVI